MYVITYTNTPVDAYVLEAVVPSVDSLVQWVVDISVVGSIVVRSASVVVGKVDCDSVVVGDEVVVTV